ncbi:MAG: Xaa-Pro peptidase family protein [Gemmataceae bacterium]|nr:Xaa-Pro peptidase family protein [Gemmataceae bacterium]
MNYAARRDRLAYSLRQQGLDALLVSAAVNVRYLTGFTGGGGSFLLLTPDRSLLISDGRFPEQIAEECPGLPAYIRALGELTVDAVGRVLVEHKLTRVGIEANRLTVRDLEKLRERVKSATWVSTDGLVETERAVKDADEIAIIRRAVAAAEGVFLDLRAQVRGDDTEFDLTNRIEQLTRVHGGQRTSFEPITAVGDRSALAHAPPTARRVDSAAFTLIDWGVVVDGYASDLTRMLVPDKPSVRSASTPRLDLDRLNPVWNAVVAARDAAVAVLRPGAATSDADAAARKAIGDAGFGDRFTHSLGHGIGLEVHEGPTLRSNSETKLVPGNVVTVEPGIYIPGFGGVRIEDDVLITPDGVEVLSTLPRDLESARF